MLSNKTLVKKLFSNHPMEFICQYQFSIYPISGIVYFKVYIQLYQNQTPASLSNALSTPEAENREPAKHAQAELEKRGCL